MGIDTGARSGLVIGMVSPGARGHTGSAARVEIAGKNLDFEVPNPTTAWRVETLLTKEPETIAWLDRLDETSTLLDVGANVGLYSIYAAAVRGARVVALEPESQNYALLNRNIFANGLDTHVRALPIALSDAPAIDVLYLSQFAAGASCHNFANNVDFDGRTFPPDFAQGCLAAPLDLLVESFGLPVPDHIKIDVDGIEHRVIAGALRTLATGRVRSVLVEINSRREDHRAALAAVEALGFERARELEALAPPADGACEGLGNCILIRE